MTLIGEVARCIEGAIACTQWEHCKHAQEADSASSGTPSQLPSYSAPKAPCGLCDQANQGYR